MVVCFFLLISCEKGETDSIDGLTDGFCLQIDDKVVLNHYDVDYYDFSDNRIYLQSSNDFFPDTIKTGIFTVYANMDSIYSGHILPSYSSYLYPGPVIYSQPFLFSDNSFSIGCVLITDLDGNTNTDPRNDDRIAKALKKYGQFHE